MNSKKQAGSIVILLGLIGLIFFFFIFDTSVSVNGLNMRVNNIGLMQDRQNGIMFSILALVIGVFLVIFANKEENEALSKLANNRPASTLSGFVGSKDLSNDAYRLYLTKKYDVEKNSTLEKFSCGGAVFENLESALEYACKLDSNRPKVIVNVIPQSMLLGFKSYSFFINGVEACEPLLMGETKTIEVDSGESILQLKMNIAVGNIFSPMSDPFKIYPESGQVKKIDLDYDGKSGKPKLNLVD